MVSKAGELSVVKAALLEIEKLQSELYDLRSSADEGFAIVGMSCRMPGGVQSPEDLWKAVVAKRCVIMDPPSTRCFDFGGVDHSISNPDIAAKMRGGYVQDPYALDSRFFGISHRELQSLDPQQRYLLELTWEAFEHAGIDPEKLRDSSTGVFVGITSNDYGRLLEMAGSAQERDAYFVTGNVLNTAAGRIAHTWGLRGPAISLDTACSSSLSALHLGIGSLRSRESSMAIISGVNLIFSPVATLALQKANVISASGYCKPFDAAADGYVRSEGGGVLILKRLSDALDSNDRIFAVVKGTAMNHVGPSAGLTVPTESSQIDLIKRALKA
ncbi:beta-ketoacyl [acyl carrier protein] synthase domain-containing protein, partial [Pseudomonas sp. EL_65y_Pfl2_R96]|uniref:beta-ketoacyl [acyl carrier protein] synthase domain-containing protein n=1 Tax=Pseudomonas sp. EL_65y_Pfl2_R96 TaxID=3088699 RepID=UPI0030D7A9B6